jgi:hypothetical protein
MLRNEMSGCMRKPTVLEQLFNVVTLISQQPSAALAQAEDASLIK